MIKLFMLPFVSLQGKLGQISGKQYSTKLKVEKPMKIERAFS